MTEKTVRESEDKIRVETKVKRGNGTRDQDTIKVKVRGDNAAEVVDKLDTTLELLEYTAEDVRRIQPTDAP